MRLCTGMGSKSCIATWFMLLTTLTFHEANGRHGVTSFHKIMPAVGDTKAVAQLSDGKYSVKVYNKPPTDCKVLGTYVELYYLTVKMDAMCVSSASAGDLTSSVVSRCRLGTLHIVDFYFWPDGECRRRYHTLVNTAFMRLMENEFSGCYSHDVRLKQCLGEGGSNA